MSTTIIRIIHVGLWTLILVVALSMFAQQKRLADLGDEHQRLLFALKVQFCRTWQADADSPAQLQQLIHGQPLHSSTMSVYLQCLDQFDQIQFARPPDQSAPH